MLTRGILLGLDHAEIRGNGIVTLGTPTDIVGITESINVQDVDETRGHEGVLHETGKHVPGVKEHETGEEVEDVGGADGHNDISERRLFNQRKEHIL